MKLKEIKSPTHAEMNVLKGLQLVLNLQTASYCLINFDVTKKHYNSPVYKGVSEDGVLVHLTSFYWGPDSATKNSEIILMDDKELTDKERSFLKEKRKKIMYELRTSNKQSYREILKI